MFTCNKEINKALGIDAEINLNEKEFIGLIITTNFEHDHEMINGKYTKISWKEWLWLMTSFEKEESIEGILDKVRRNYYWEIEIGI